MIRQQHAYGILAAAMRAKKYHIPKITVIEFGVSSGTWLLNLVELARRVESATGIGIDVVGFDSGTGMPEPNDYRDHPDMYVRGDFPMDFDLLNSKLPAGVKLVLGPVAETVRDFVNSNVAPIGFVTMDLDYYSSTKDAMRVFDGVASSYSPYVDIYFDDIYSELHNSWCGELLAINEFNAEHDLRK